VTTPADIDRRDFFISHSSADERWAEWIATQLERAGYLVELDVWEWEPGSNFIRAMEQALRRADRVISLYSPSYFTRPYSQAEHQAAAATAIREQSSRVIPVQIADCDIPELYQNIVRINLIGLDEDEAVRRLLTGVAGNAKPRRTPIPYPGYDAMGMTRSVRYPGHLPSVWRVPPRNRFFVGRKGLLGKVHATLQPGGRAVAVTSLQGIGGVGKTQIAIEYAYAQARSYKIVWWVDSDSPNLIMDSLLLLAEELGIGTSDPKRAIELLWRELRVRDDWLLIYDNVDRIENILEWRPPASGRWLLTSRNPAISRIATVIEVQEFGRDESVGLLALRVPSLGTPEAEYIAEALGDLPLAIEQAAYFLSETGFEARDYVRLLHEHPVGAGLDEATTDRHPGLVTAVVTAIERLEADDRETARLVNLLSILAPEPLPVASAPGRPAENEPPSSFGVSLGTASVTAGVMRKMAASGLAKRVGHSVQMHRITQLILSSRLSEETAAELRREAVYLFGRSEPGDPKLPGDWPNFAAATPHLYALTGQDLLLPDWGDYEEFGQFALSCVEYFYRSGRYGDGVALAAQCYRSWRNSLGETHLLTLRMKNNLGTCMTGLGELEAATQLYRELHAEYIETLGPDAPRALHTANNIGVILITQHKFAEAVEILQPTLDRMKAIANPNQAEMLRTANNLAEALYRSGEGEAAIQLASENLQLRRDMLPPDHPDVLESMHTLGSVLSKHDREVSAQLLAETLEARIRVLGEEHPETRRTKESFDEINSQEDPGESPA